MKHVSDLALRENDYLLGQIFYSLNNDCEWHRQWSESLVRMAIEYNVGNRDVIQTWISKWYPLAARAVNTFTSLIEDSERNQTAHGESPGEALDRYYRDYPSSDGPGTVSSTSRVKQTAYQKANCRRRRNWNNV